jgi:hypothetical protein
MPMPLPIFRVQPWYDGVPPLGPDAKVEGLDEKDAAERLLQEPMQYEQRPAMYIRAVVRGSIGRRQINIILYAAESSTH